MNFYKYLAVISGIAIILLFVKLGAVSVFQVAEARNSQVAVEMMEAKEYVVPFFNGAIRTDKPPLHYYAMILAYKITGVSEASARFFSGVSGLLVIIATWFFVKRNAGVKAAWWSSLILLSSLHVIFQFRLATPDPYLIACHVLSLYAFWEGYKLNKERYFFGMYLLWGLAILAKGPVGILLPAGTIFLYLLFTRSLNWATLRSFQLLWGIVIVLLVAVPWFYLVHLRTGGEWTKGFFITHNIDRFSEPVDGHKGPFFLTLLFIVAGLFPFSFFLIKALGDSWRQRKQNAWLFFNLLAAACIVIPYSVSSTKLINYTSPSYPFLAIITGIYIKNFIGSKSPERRKFVPEWILLGTTAITLPVVLFYWMNSQPGFYSERYLSGLLLVLPIAVIAGGFYYFRGLFYKGFLIVALGSILQNVLFFSILYPAIDACGSVQKQKNILAAADHAIAYRNFNNAFTFYHKKPIGVLPSVSAVLNYLNQYPSALVLERASYTHLKDSLPGLSVISMERDLFSRQYSIMYQLK